MPTMPPGILTQPVRLPNGMIYVFSHKQLGKLGRLILTDVAGRGTQISAEVEPGEISDPTYLKRLELLSQVIQTVLDALPGENPPMPSLEEAKQKVALYQRFIHVQDAAEMAAFARSLSPQEQTVLLGLIADTISSSREDRDSESLYGLVQREHDLRRFLAL
jgi:hypothetical protein